MQETWLHIKPPTLRETLSILTFGSNADTTKINVIQPQTRTNFQVGCYTVSVCHFPIDSSVWTLVPRHWHHFEKWRRDGGSRLTGQEWRVTAQFHSRLVSASWQSIGCHILLPPRSCQPPWLSYPSGLCPQFVSLTKSFLPYIFPTRYLVTATRKVNNTESWWQNWSAGKVLRVRSCDLERS